MNRLFVQKFETQMPWQETYAKQLALVEALQQDPTNSAHLMLLEHKPVFTLGRMTKPAHLPFTEDQLKAQFNADVERIDRGGSITYHGPGQLTAYLLLNLKTFELNIHQHLTNLEEMIIQTLNALGIDAFREEGMTGVWTKPTPSSDAIAKICALGVGCKRWVTYHGVALNVDLDLAPFQAIDPCGLGNKPVTSIAQLLKKPISIGTVQDILQTQCLKLLNAELAHSD